MCARFCVRGYVDMCMHWNTALFATDIYYEYANYARARVNEAPIKSKIILLALFLFILIQRMKEVLKHFIAFVRSFVHSFIHTYIHIHTHTNAHTHFFFLRDFVVKVIYIFRSCYMIRHTHTQTHTHTLAF